MLPLCAGLGGGQRVGSAVIRKRRQRLTQHACYLVHAVNGPRCGEVRIGGESGHDLARLDEVPQGPYDSLEKRIVLPHLDNVGAIGRPGIGGDSPGPGRDAPVAHRAARGSASAARSDGRSADDEARAGGYALNRRGLGQQGHRSAARGRRRHREVPRPEHSGKADAAQPARDRRAFPSERGCPTGASVRGCANGCLSERVLSERVCRA